MAENTELLDLDKPDAKLPDTETTPVMEPMISVDVSDRLLRQIQRRIFPTDLESILLSAQVGDLWWKNQLWSLMVQTWPRLATNLGKLKQAVSSMEYDVKPFAEKGEKPTNSAIEKADFVEDALLGMHGDLAAQEHDFQQTLEDVVDALVSGFFVAEIYWEVRNGGMVPQCTRWTPSRYWRFPYVLDQKDELLLNPSGMLGGTQLFPFPEYKFIRAIKQTHADHPVFSCPMDCLTSWWLASRFGLEWFMTFAQLFGIPRRVAYYSPGDDITYQKLVQMMRQSAAATWGVYPKGTQVEDQAAAGSTGGHLPQERLIDEADKVCDIMLLGQTLTTEVHESGGNRALGQVHRRVQDEVMIAAANFVAKIFNTQVIPGILQYNWGNISEIPILEPVVNSPVDLFNLAQALKIIGVDMKLPLKAEEVYTRLEFTQPDPDEGNLYEPPAAPIAPPPPFSAQPQPNGTRPEPAGAPNGSKEPGAKPNIVERVGAAGLGDADCCDPTFDDGDGNAVHAAARKVSFALNYGEEPEPGEVLRFLEHVEAREHGVTTVIAPKQLDRSPAEAAASHDTGQYFRENAATIKGVKWRSILDDRTTQECRDLHNKRWTYPDLKPIGHELEFPDFPPIKYNCRSSVMPVLKTWPQIQQWLKGLFKR